VDAAFACARGVLRAPDERSTFAETKKPGDGPGFLLFRSANTRQKFMQQLESLADVSMKYFSDFSISFQGEMSPG
jgi:hypothetical protein